MHDSNNKNFLEFIKKVLMKIKPRFSFHYVAYTTLFTIIVFSVVSFVTATTPNPGHPWSELGDGVFSVLNNQTANRTYTFPDANATVLTTNAVITVAQGGTGVGTLTGLVKGNGTGAFTAAVAGVDYQAPGSFQDSHANLTSLSGLSYVSPSFVKMTAAGTFALDTNTYLTGTKVDSFNTRTGAVTLTSADVTGALAYTPYNSTNPSGYISDGNTGWDNSYGFITDGNTGWDNSYGYITDDTSVPKNNLANSGTLPFTWSDAEVSDTLTASYATSAGNSDTLDSKHLTDTTGNNGVTWDRIPFIKTDGVMEISRYLDFHDATTDGVDYAARIYSTGSQLSTSGDLGVNGILKIGSPSAYSTLRIKQNNTTNYGGIWLESSGSTNTLALSHDGSVGYLTTEYTTGGGATPLELRTWNGQGFIRINTNGNVGIGTISPNAKLEIHENSNADTELRIMGQAGYDPRIYLKSEEADTEGFKMWYDNSVGDTYFDNIYSQANQTAPAIRFRTNVDGSINGLVNAMTIVHNGNVGIGTTSPGNGLHVSVNQNQVANFQSPNANTWVDLTSTTQVWSLGSASEGFNIYQRSGTNLSRFVINNSGNVGINDTTPDFKLDVKGNAQFDDTGTYSSYTWAGGTVQTNSLEILDRVSGSTSDGIYPTISFHDYGNGGAQFSMEGATTTLHLGSAAASSAGTLGTSGSYFSKFKVWGALDATGAVTAERFKGINSLVLSSYATVNPASNVFLYSQSNDRDSWLYLDSADTGSNWGIYHRQIDSAVSGLPGNSIGFVGGGASALQAYISLANGSAGFSGTVTAPTFSGALSGNATSATTATNQSGGTVSATTGTFSGAVNFSDSIAVNYQNDITTLKGILTLYGSGNATTSQIMFKNTTGLGYGNHGAITGSYNTYFVMDTSDRGWIFRNATTATNVASISNTGVITATTFSGALSGNATSATTAGTASAVSGLTLTSSSNGINPDSVSQNQIGYNTSVSLFGQTDGGLYSSAYSSAWIHQIYGDFRSGQMAIRGKNNGSWTGWRTVWDSGNLTNLNQLSNGPGYLTSSGVINNSYYQAATGTNNDWVTSFNSTPPHSTSFREMSANGPAGTWWFMQNLRHSNASNSWGTQLAWGWEDNQNQLYQRNVTGGSWSGWVKYLNSGNYNSYSPTLTGGGASGTWGIGISGNAATATSAGYATTAGGAFGLGYDGNAISGAGPVSNWDSRPGVGYAGFAINYHTGVTLSGYPGYGGVRLYSAGYPTHAGSILRLEASSAVYTYGGLYSDGNAVVHAGNIGSQSVSYASSAGSVTNATNATNLTGGVATMSSLKGTDQTIENTFGAYQHLGAWGVGRTDASAVLVNTAYMADIATTASALSSMNISQFTNNSGYMTPSTLSVSSTTKIANLNADLLDGFDSSAFGDATAANQTTILNRIGTSSDAASMSSSLFAGQQYIADNMKPVFMGYTGATTTPAMGGTKGASDMCTAAYSGSHACTYNDIIQLGPNYPWSQNAWAIDGIDYTYVSAGMGGTSCTKDGASCQQTYPIYLNCAGWSTCGSGGYAPAYTTSGKMNFISEVASYVLPCCK